MFLCLWQDIANDGYGPFAVTVYLIVMAAVVGILRQHFLTAAVCCMLMCAVYNYIQGGWSEVIEYSLLDYVITGTVLEIIAVAGFLILGFLVLIASAGGSPQASNSVNCTLDEGNFNVNQVVGAFIAFITIGLYICRLR